jgi:hypothetical protein
MYYFPSDNLLFDFNGYSYRKKGISALIGKRINCGKERTMIDLIKTGVSTTVVTNHRKGMGRENGYIQRLFSG